MEKDTDALMQQIHKESVEVVEPHKKAIQAEEEEAVTEDIEMDTNIDTKDNGVKAKKAKKDVVKIIEEPEADQEMVMLQPTTRDGSQFRTMQLFVESFHL